MDSVKLISLTRYPTTPRGIFIYMLIVQPKYIIYGITEVLQIAVSPKLNAHLNAVSFADPDLLIVTLSRNTLEAQRYV
jgi:hypothetical protein